MHVHNPKKGVLGTGTIPKWGNLGTDTRRRRWVRTGLVKRQSIYIVDLTDVAQKGVLGVYLLITSTFVNMINWWAFTLTLKKRGLI